MKSGRNPGACDQEKISLLYDSAQDLGEVYSDFSQLQVRWATDETLKNFRNKPDKIFLRDELGVQPMPISGLPPEGAADSEGCYPDQGTEGETSALIRAGDTSAEHEDCSWCLHLVNIPRVWIALHILCCQIIYLGNWSLQARLPLEIQVMCTVCQVPGLKNKARTSLTGQVKWSSASLYETLRDRRISAPHVEHLTWRGSLLCISSCNDHNLHTYGSSDHRYG